MKPDELRKMRLQSGMSQEQLARRLGYNPDRAFLCLNLANVHQPAYAGGDGGRFTKGAIRK